MLGKPFRCAVLLATVAAAQIRAQEPAAETEPVAPAASSDASSAAPARSSLQREYARLAQLLNSDDHFGRQEAAQTLLRVRPGDVANPDTKKLIARGYLSLLKEDGAGTEDEAIQGLVIWGGKYAVPMLIEKLEGEKLSVSEHIFDGLAKAKDPRGAEATARFLGNFFNHDKAVASLRKMGPVAEDALIKAAPSNDPKVSLAAVQLLGDVGTDKSMSLLTKASSSKNAEVKLAARDAMKRIRQRQKGGTAPNLSQANDADSPFAEGSGPAVDVTARNSRTGGRRSEQSGAGASGNSADDASATEKPVEDVNEGDWTNVHALLPGDPVGVGVPLDPATDSFDPKWRPQPTRLGKTAGSSERPTAIDISGGDSPIAVVVYGDPFNKSIGRMEIANLRQRKSLGSVNILGGESWCALSPKGNQVLIVGKGEGHDAKSRLTVTSINGAKANEVATWWPYASSKGWNSDVKWAAWLDDEQFLTLNGDGMLVLWKLNGNKPSAVYQIDASADCEPALSPGRNHLALATQRGIEIFRAADGELLARMSGVSAKYGALAFSENGGHLACVSGKSVYVWNATTGKLQRDFDCNAVQGGQNSSVTWLDDKRLLVGGSDVVDLPKRLVLWRYDGVPLVSTPYGGWQWMVMESGNILGIVPAKLLTEEVMAADDDLDPNAILALKPGTKVALDLQLGGEELAKAEEALKAGLQQSGMEVVPAAPVRLTARIVTGKSDTQEYTRGFSPFNRSNAESVTVTEKRYEVELTLDGESLWKQTSTLQSGWAPSVVHMQEGESIQQAVDRQASQYSSGFSFGASLPRYVVHPKYAGPLGTTKLTPGGE